MLRWFQALMPREAGFFDLFDRHAATLVAGAGALRQMLDGDVPIAEGCTRIVQHETEADDITREVLIAVRRTFVTPFDRGDIKDLITSLDDAIDQMQKTAKAVTLFEVETFEPAMKEMGAVIVTAAERTREAVALLRDMRRNGARLNAVTEEVTHLEEQADGMHDTGLKTLFKAHRHSDPMAYIVGVEIYDHLEKVMDRFEDVANRINGIVLEHL
jgi:predicted phosphate transport protein (TIGR00153 family)